ncbi:GIY-YIG nuclease family protein [Alkalimonas sp. MEB108]|uniref:GIY-YIG nuclease family protein n=1 Tax=Alkalimonas cellulosilytica TaxID=3058395 RepID=A0ABU7J9A8_9GAMM|nr:GIY-YIG nuclease family protein [Alkalimonas sp. MEB108]MEE2003114.1 GIY-YIG nuclease family protein [Alkalimonas sp. MEB108]
MPEQDWFLYLLRSNTGQIYTGITTNPLRRLRQHNGELAGGAKALRGQRPLQLLYQEPYPCRSSASKAEYQFKQLSKQQKEDFIRLKADGALASSPLE